MAVTAERHRISKTMGLDHADFWRVAPAVMEGFDWRRLGADRLVGEQGKGRIEIHLAPETRRRIAMFELPTTELTIEFFNLDATERRAFLENFDRRFRRGGG
ncbi:hypothetical protein M0534_04450 [Methylonatrum kenyense]|uniref:hypothetical protein n=1 Tax=Methylonatrum kenyense TaxID=455253 RepID=UPI0020BF611C|nr:hypothetical protein [Methylonatrum kenyense]MCK8515578.1 hypothetical protein [Methylonatrum kenyense]